VIEGQEVADVVGGIVPEFLGQRALAPEAGGFVGGRGESLRVEWGVLLIPKAVRRC
jgi:hypothetical protein